MQLVIDIPDGYVGVVMRNQRTDGSAMDKLLRHAVIDGIPLPKDHGPIKDVSQIEIPMCEDRTYERWVQVAINSAPTIIKAERSNVEE